MTDRLTIAAARPGMLPDNLAEIIEEEMREWRGANGGVFAIPACALGISIAIRAAMRANPAPALTPGLIEALREWGRYWVQKRPVSERNRNLLAAIEAAGILDKPAPSQPFHLTPQQFQEMHNAG